LLLHDSQDERAAGSTARAAKITRVPARSIDRHACCSCCGDYGSRNRGLQLLTARGSGFQRCAVDDHHRGRNEITALHSEKKALLHFSERNRRDRKRPNDRCWPSTSAEGIECVAALKNEQDKENGAQKSKVPQRRFTVVRHHRPIRGFRQSGGHRNAALDLLGTSIGLPGSSAAG
jgi:hypothetical protein